MTNKQACGKVISVKSAAKFESEQCMTKPIMSKCCMYTHYNTQKPYDLIKIAPKYVHIRTEP